MAPALWARQLDAGACAVTLANFAQLRVAREFGVGRLQLANELTDPGAIAWLIARQKADPGFEFTAWVDSAGGVALLQARLDDLGTAGALDLIVDLGAAGGRSGARSHSDALDVARAVHQAPSLRLVGVGGYEGALAHQASDAGLATVREYLAGLRRLHEALLAGNLYAPNARRIVTAGGSAFFDTVVEVLASCARPAGPDDPGTAVVLRSGAYIIHDDGFYRAISPFARGAGRPFRSAMHAWARVVSVPEDGLALLDAGKRDVPYDEGLPEPQTIAAGLGRPQNPLTGADITAVNDQHAFLRFDPAGPPVRVGDVVRLGLSHPCTALQAWQFIPVLDEDPVNPRILDVLRTFF